MNPCQLNASIALFTNHLYSNMSKEDFLNLGIVLSFLSKDMLEMAALERLLKWEHDHDKKSKNKKEKESDKKDHDKKKSDKVDEKDKPDKKV